MTENKIEAGTVTVKVVPDLTGFQEAIENAIRDAQEQIARAFFEPRTVTDEDGDVWVEIEPDLFRLQDTERTATLDEIEENYGIDAGEEPQAEPPLAEWERELLAGIDEKPVERFAVGDRVVLTGPHYIADGMTERTYDESPNGIGSIATVSYLCDAWGKGKAYGVSWDGGDSSVVAASSLSPLPVLPEIGSTVRLAPATRSFTAPTGSLATVEEVDPARWGNATPAISVRWHGETPQSNGFYAAADFQPFVADEVGDPEGSLLFVTGDSDEWGHGFEAGTAVRVTGDDYVLDGSYLVRAVKSGRTEFVGASDLDVSSPRQQTIPNETLVRIKSDGSNDGLRHYLEVGSFAKVTGWLDTSTEEGSSYEETYRVEGTYDGKGGTLTDPLVQSVAPETIEVVDLEAFPRRYVLGADPSVTDWSEIMKSAVFRFEDPAPRTPANYCGICRTAPCALGVPTRV